MKSMVPIAVTGLILMTLIVSCSTSIEQTLCVSESSMRENNAVRTSSMVLAEARNISLSNEGISHVGCELSPNTKITYQIINKAAEKQFEVNFASENVTVTMLEKGIYTPISDASRQKAREASISTIKPGVGIVLEIVTPVGKEGSYTFNIIPRTSESDIPFGLISIILIVLIILLFAGFLFRKPRTQPNLVSSHEEAEDSSAEHEKQIEKEDKSIARIHEELRVIGEKILGMENSMETSSILRRKNQEIEQSLTNYINGYNFSVLKIAITDWIDAYELSIEASSYIADNKHLQSPEIEGFLTAITSYLRQGLEIAGVEQFQPKVGNLYQTEFGATLVESIPAEDTQNIGKIAETRRAGWKTRLPEDESTQQVIREAQVVVYN